ncbi:hypothetical protein WNY37_12460 [Henriciella sp. AS95]|uniref:hypothetical protein n=1 Tax=Henriciella sp. AS95 TaxID=3135782 RepID=UPI0031824488
MRLRLCSALAAITLAACETTPVPVSLTEAEFNAVVASAQAEWHPYITIEEYSETLDTATLTDAQRAQLLFERGKTRRLERINLPGAIEDFDAATTLTTDAAFLAILEDEKNFAASDLALARGRLGRLQTLSEWFVDTVAIGDFEAVAERIRASGLSPSAEQARFLEAAGYLCRGAEDEPSEDFTLGEDIGHLDAINWCEAPSET